MATKLIRVNKETLTAAELKVGTKGSWTSKINKLLDPINKEAIPLANSATPIDYKQIKKIVEDCLYEFKSGRI